MGHRDKAQAKGRKEIGNGNFATETMSGEWGVGNGIDQPGV